MNITVTGAAGSVGHEVAHLVVAEQLLRHDQRLLLVGNPAGASAKSLFGFAVDLMDAYAEHSPHIEVILEPEAVTGDLIIMAGGSSA